MSSEIRPHYEPSPQSSSGQRSQPTVVNATSWSALESYPSFSRDGEHSHNDSDVLEDTFDPFLSNPNVNFHGGRLAHTIRPSIAGVEFPEPDLCYAFSQDGTRLVTYDNGFFRIWKVSDFSELGRADAEAVHRVVNLSFVGEGNSTFIVFFNNLSSAVFNIDEEMLNSTVSIEQDWRCEDDDAEDLLNEQGLQLVTNVDCITDQKERSHIVHCAENQAGEIVLAISKGKTRKWKRLSCGNYFKQPFKYSHAYWTNGNLLMIGREETGSDAVVQIGLWYGIQTINAPVPFTTLQGSDGKFADGGYSAITWDGCTSHTPEEERCVYFYNINALTQAGRVIANPRAYERSRSRADALQPMWTFEIPTDTKVLHVETNAALHNNEGEAPSLLSGSKLVLLCDVSGSANAMILVVDMKTKNFDYRLNTSWTYTEELQSPFQLVRTMYEQRPVAFSSRRNWIFISDPAQKRGSFYSLDSQHPKSMLDWSLERGFVPKHIQFDATGKHIILDNGVIMMHFTVGHGRSHSRTASTRIELGSLLSINTVSVIDYYRHYDKIAFNRLVSRGFALKHQVRNELTPVLKKDVLSGLWHRKNAMSQGEVLQIVLSPDKSTVAFVVHSSVVHVEFWKVTELKDEVFPLTHQWRKALLPHVKVDKRIGDGVGLFCTTSDGREAFAYISPQADGVRIVPVCLDTVEISDVHVIRPRDGDSVQNMKVTEDGSKALIVFRNGRFTVLQLTGNFTSELTGQFRYPCGVVGFVNFFIAPGMIHISRDGKRLVTGWDSEAKSLVSFSLDIPESWMTAEYNRCAAHLTETNFRLVPWINKHCTRALVHTKEAGPTSLVMFDISDATGTEMLKIPACVPRRRESTSIAGSQIEWNTESESIDHHQVRLFAVYALLGLQEDPPDDRMLDLVGQALTEEHVKMFISKFGVGVINAGSSDKKSLVQHAVMEQKLGCAKLLFDHAAEQNVFVDLCWRQEDLLGWSIESNSTEAVEFILERIAEKNAHPAESAHLVRKHFDELLERFPHVLERFLSRDSFLSTLGSFSVPASLFRGDESIAMTCDDVATWEAANSEEVKDLWKKNRPDLAHRLDDESGVQVTAVSKFLCIEGPVYREPSSIISQLVNADCPGEVFKASGIKMLVQWKWKAFLESPFQRSLMVHLMAAVAFSFFAANFGIDTDPKDSGQNRNGESKTSSGAAFLAILISLFLQLFLLTENMFRGVRAFPCVVSAVLGIYSFVRTHHVHWTAALTSCGCIYIWLSVLFYLQPYKWAGAATVILRHVFNAVRLYILLSVLLILGFGLSFRVLFQPRFVPESLDVDDDYSSFPRSIQSTYFGLFGVFEPDLFRQTDPNFIAMWRTFLFCVFLFLAGMVLLGLLIAILVDLYDRSRAEEEAEMLKTRARMAGLWDGWFGTVERNISTEQRYVHFLVPAEPIKVEKTSLWNGKILEIARFLKSALARNEQRAKREREDLRKELRDFKAEFLNHTSAQNVQLKNQVEAMRTQISKLEESIGRLSQGTT